MEKNSSDEQKKKVIFVGLTLSVLMVIIGVSYAFFSSPVEKEEEKLNFKAGDLVLTFRDNDETVENTEGTWNFGDSIEKELVIENTGTLDSYAKISWDNLINTYLAESLTYTLEEKSEETNAVWKLIETENVNVPRSESASTLSLADHLFIPAGHTYTYRVRITFEDLPDIDQTADLHAKFITKFILEQGKPDVPLLELIENVKTVAPNFASPATTDETAEGLFSMEDDYGTSYYFRGTAPNNYIKFGRNVNGQDMWWRIIRINGDGTIRMQYDGAGTSGSNTYTRGFALSNQIWTEYKTDAKYAGWMFGGANGSASTSKEQAQRNETDLPLKTKVDEWYKENIVDTGYHSYVADSIFCNDRSSSGAGYGQNVTAYGFYSKNALTFERVTPEFTCPQENDKFTVEETSGGNGALTYPVGLITSAEIVAAGSGNYKTANNSYYLNKEEPYYSLSPCNFSGFDLSVFAEDGMFRGYNTGAGYTANVAPVINLKAKYLDKLHGKGTIDNPYFLRNY